MNLKYWLGSIRVAVKIAVMLAIAAAIDRSVSFAQSDVAENPPASGKPPTTEKATIDDDQASLLIEQLGAATFAERERGLGEILRVGMPMLPHLRAAAKDETDPERALRVIKALAQLTTGNFEARVTKFLSGRDDGEIFEGWQTVAATLGDTPAVRDLFVEIMRVHPQLVESLDGTTRDRSLAAEQTAQAIQTAMFQDHRFPTMADGIALLLPLIDPAVTISGGYEAALVSVLQKQMSIIRRDGALWVPVSGLLDRWVNRSRIENRNDVLWYAMQWDITGAATLGLRTLDETTDIETLQTAMQSIARFGVPEDGKQLAKFIDDDRPAATRMPVMIGEASIRVTLGDVAMAAIAVLNKVPLSDIGMKQGELHSKVGFLVDNAGYLPAEKDARVEAKQIVRNILDGKPPQEKPRS